MKTVEELEQEIKEIENKVNATTKEYQNTMKSHVENMKKLLEELKKSNSFEPTSKTWTPNIDEVFWVANIELKPVVYNNVEQFKSRNSRIFKYNRIFKTLEECQLYCDIQRAFRDASKPFVVDERNYYICYNHNLNKIKVETYGNHEQQTLYFESREKIYDLINKFGEENVKRYYLGVY